MAYQINYNYGFSPSRFSITKVHESAVYIHACGSELHLYMCARNVVMVVTGRAAVNHLGAFV